MQKFLATVFIAMMTAAAFAEDIAPPTAPDSSIQQSQFTAWNGSHRRSIVIDVPGFRGLEPQLSLTYDSARGIRGLSRVGGALGLGWSLDGLSAIERQSGSPEPTSGTDKTASGQGVPAYGAAGMPADSFSLDGNELVPCAAVQNPSSTPSCAVPVETGQTAYATRIESYQRVRHQASTNSWEVTARNGVTYAYTSMEGETADSTFRWYLTAVADRRGNSVVYTWDCDDQPDCVIASISYRNQGSTEAAAEIKFHTARRPDAVTYATGKDIRSVTRRIMAIEVQSSGSVLRAYKLTYSQASSSGLSLLTQVQQFGRDASISAGGAVTGPTSLPPYVMSYSKLADSTGSPSFTSMAWNRRLESWRRVDNGRAYLGDINGDGLRPDFYTRPIAGAPYKLDDVLHYKCSSNVSFANGTLSTTATSFTIQSSYPLCVSDNSNSAFLSQWRYLPPAARDYDGDGADDYPTVRWTTSTTSTTKDGDIIKTTKYGPALLDFHKWDGKQMTTFMSASSQSSTTTTSPQPFDGGINAAVDVTGDGVADLLTRNKNVWTKNGSTMVSNSWSMPTFPTSSLIATVIDFNRRVDTGDFNGDGKADLLEHWFATDQWHSVLYISSGTDFVKQTQQSIVWQDLNFNSSAWVLADANGDGLTDLIVAKPSSASAYEVRRLLSTGRSFQTAVAPVQILSGFNSIPTKGFHGWVSPSRPPLIVAANLNGDGRADLLLWGMRVASENNNGGYALAFSGAGGFVLGNPVSAHEDDEPYKFYREIADFTGDGLDDLYDGSDGYNMRINKGPVPDLLLSMTEPMGGSQTVTYKSSAGTPQTKLPFVMQTVARLLLKDGRGNTSKTDYAYTGGAWNGPERQFMGFRTVTATLPANQGETVRPQIVSTYQQSAACLGKTSLVETKDGSGTVMAADISGYTTDTQVPLICTETSAERKFYDTASSKSSKQTYAYDLYGNAARITDYGELTNAGDERTIYNTFYPNATDYLVSCPAIKQIVERSNKCVFKVVEKL